MRIIIILFICSFMLHAEKTIIIDLTRQVLLAKENNKTILTSPISSGRAGYETPSGNYSLIEKEKMHISNRYPIKDKKANIRGGAKMPYMLRVTNTGIAIHAGEMVPYPDSHGCVRIPYGKAMQLYKWADIKTPISIIGKTSYDDETNQMRLKLLKPKKYLDFYHSKPIQWVDDSLDYYNQM